MEQNTQKSGRAQVAAGATLLVLAAVMAGVDFANNVRFALSVSSEFAVVLGAAAIAVVLLPVAAALSGGWIMQFRIAHLVCMVMTVIAALVAYADRQGLTIDKAQGAGTRYEDARKDVEAARQKLAAAEAEKRTITETGDAGELQKIVTAHKARADAEAAKVGGACSKRRACTEAMSAYTAAIERAGKAKRRTDLEAQISATEARLAEAQKAAAAGPTQVSGLTTNAETARQIAQGMSLMAIFATQALALLGHKATKLMVDGIAAMRRVGSPDPKSGPAKPRKTRRTVKQEATAGAEIISLADAQKRVARDTVAQLLAAGVAKAEIARRTGLSRSTVSRWAKALAEAGEANEAIA